MLKTNLLVLTFGIIIGGTLQHLTVNSMKEEIGVISSLLESKLNGISQQLSESRRINQQEQPVTSGAACDLSVSWEERLADLKQSVHWAMESNVRPIIQEEFEFIAGLLPQAEAQADQIGNPQIDAENMARVEQILAMALGDGVWTQQGMDAYNAALSHMSDGAQAEASRKLAVAINSGGIEVGDVIPLF
jgi:TolA-binding protein